MRLELENVEQKMNKPLRELLDAYIKARRNGEDALRAFWNYVISIGAYDKMRQLVVYQNVIFAYQESDRDAKTESLGNGYYSKVYTEGEKEFAEQQIKKLLEEEET